MPVMKEPQRAKTATDLMREWSADREPTRDMRRSDWRALVDGVDQWINDNAAAFNLALPLGPNGARTNLTTPQKSRFLRDLLRMRVELGVD